ncbi:MAG: hypothetical protein WC738_06905, partial [Candidatus Omnitrophota bacterium]
SSILDSLVTNYDMKLVAVEGSSGYIDTSILKTFPDESIRKDTAKYLMSQGKMSAGEFFSITSNKPIELYGIEDENLYLENVDQFRKVYELDHKINGDIVNLLKTLETLKGKIYSEDLKKLDSNSVLHQDGKISFTDRWGFVSALAKKHNLDNSKYVNLTKLVNSLKLEKGINFEKANKERDALIDTLSKNLARHELEELVLKSLSFKTNKISQGEYYTFLQAEAEKIGVDPEPYKNLIAYTKYITLYESIDLLEIFSEVKDFETAIKEKIYTTPEQKKLHDVSMCIDFVKDLYGLKLTNGDFEYLQKNIVTCNASVIAQFIRDMSVKYNIPIESDYDLGEIFSNIPVAMEFYKTAEKRNNTMLANTIKTMDAEGQTIAAVITGGYHTKGLSELLRRKETSYLVILPKFDASKGERPYVAILTNKKAQYEPLLANGQYYLATVAYCAKVETLVKEVSVNPEALPKLEAELVDGLVCELLSAVTNTPIRNENDFNAARSKFYSMSKADRRAAGREIRSLIKTWVIAHRNYTEKNKADVPEGVALIDAETLERLLYGVVADYMNMDLRVAEEAAATPGDARLIEIEGRLKKLEETIKGEGETRESRIAKAVNSVVDMVSANPSKANKGYESLLERALRAQNVQLKDGEMAGIVAQVQARLEKPAGAQEMIDRTNEFIEKRKLTKKQLKESETEVRLAELLPTQKTELKNAVARYKKDLASVDPEGAASLKMEDVKILSNMDVIAYHRGGNVVLDRVLLSNSLAMTLSILHERLHAILRSVTRPQGMSEAERILYEETFVTQKTMEYLYSRHVSEKERQDYFDFLKNSYHIKHGLFMKLVADYEMLMGELKTARTAGQKDVVRAKIVTTIAKHVKRAHSIELAEKDKDFCRNNYMGSKAVKGRIGDNVGKLTAGYAEEVKKAEAKVSEAARPQAPPIATPPEVTPAKAETPALAAAPVKIEVPAKPSLFSADVLSRTITYTIVGVLILSMFFFFQPQVFVSAVSSFDWFIGTTVINTSLSFFGVNISAGKIMLGLMLFEAIATPVRLGLKSAFKAMGLKDNIPVVDIRIRFDSKTLLKFYVDKDEILEAFRLRFGIDAKEALKDMDGWQALRAYKMLENGWFDTLDNMSAARHTQKLGVAGNFLKHTLHPVELLKIIYGFYPAFYWRKLVRAYRSRSQADLTASFIAEGKTKITGKELVRDIFDKTVLPAVLNQRAISTKIWQSRFATAAALWRDSIFIRGTLEFIKARLTLALAGRVGHFLILGPLSSAINLNSPYFAEVINQAVSYGTASAAGANHAAIGALGSFVGEFAKAGVGNQFTIASVLGSFSTAFTLKVFSTLFTVYKDYRQNKALRLVNYINRRVLAQIAMSTWGMWFVNIEIPLILGYAAATDAALWGQDRPYIHDTLALVEGHEGAIGVGNTILDRVLGISGFGGTQQVLAPKSEVISHEEKLPASVKEEAAKITSKQEILKPAAVPEQLPRATPEKTVIEKPASPMPNELAQPILSPTIETATKLPGREIERKPAPLSEAEELPFHFVGGLKYERATDMKDAQGIWYVSGTGENARRLEMRSGAVFEKGELKGRGALYARIGYYDVTDKAGAKKTYTYVKYTGEAVINEKFRGKAFVQTPDNQIIEIVPDTVDINNGIVSGNPLFVRRGQPEILKHEMVNGKPQDVVLEPSITLEGFSVEKCNNAIAVKNGSCTEERWVTGSNEVVRKSYLYKNKDLNDRNVLRLAVDSRRPDRVFVGDVFWGNGNVRSEKVWLARLNKDNTGIAPIYRQGGTKEVYKVEERHYNQGGAIVIQRNAFMKTVGGFERAGQTHFALLFDGAGRPMLTSDFSAPNVNFAGKQTFTTYVYDDDGNVSDKKVTDEYPAALHNDAVRPDAKTLYSHLAKLAGPDMKGYLSEDAVTGMCSAIYWIIDGNMSRPNDMLLPDQLRPIFDGINEKLDETIKLQDSGKIDIPEEFEVYVRGTLTPIQCYELERAHPGIIRALGLSIYINLYGVDAVNGIKGKPVIKHWDTLIDSMKAFKTGKIDSAYMEYLKYEWSGYIAATMARMHPANNIVTGKIVNMQTGAMETKSVPTFGTGPLPLTEGKKYDGISTAVSPLVGRQLNSASPVDRRLLGTGYGFMSTNLPASGDMDKLAHLAVALRPSMPLFRNLDEVQKKADMQGVRRDNAVTAHYANDAAAKSLAAEQQYKDKLREAEKSRAIWLDKVKRDEELVRIKYQSFSNKEMWFGSQRAAQNSTSRMTNPDSYSNGDGARYDNMADSIQIGTDLNIAKLEVSMAKELNALRAQADMFEQNYENEIAKAKFYYNQSMSEITPGYVAENQRATLHAQDNRLLAEQEDLYNLLTAIKLLLETRYNKPIAEILKTEDYDKLSAEVSAAARMIPTVVDAINKSNRTLITKTIYGSHPRTDGKVDILGETLGLIDRHMIPHGNELRVYDDEWNKIIQVITWDGEKNVWRVEHTKDNPESAGHTFIFDADRKAPICEIIPVAPGKAEAKYFIRDKDGIVIREKTVVTIDGKEVVLEEVDKSEAGKEKLRLGDLPQKDEVDKKILYLYKELYEALKGNSRLGEEKVKEEYRKHWYEWNEYRSSVMKQLEAMMSPAPAEAPEVPQPPAKASIDWSKLPTMNVDGVPHKVLIGPNGVPIMSIPVTDIVRAVDNKKEKKEEGPELGINYRGPLGAQSYGQNNGTTAWYPGGNGISKHSFELDTDLSQMRRLGITSIRTGLVDDGRTLMDKDGNVVGYNDTFKSDIRTLLNKAGNNGVKVEYYILDYLMAKERKYIKGVYTGGREAVLSNPGTREAFMHNFLVPFLKEFGSHPALGVIDVINEPEWIANTAQEKENVRQFIREVVAAARKYAPGKPVTVGVNTEFTDLVSGLDLDYIGLHHYEDRFNDGGATLTKVVTKLNAENKKWALEEFATNDSKMDVKWYYEFTKKYGGIGAKPWNWNQGIDERTWALEVERTRILAKLGKGTMKQLPAEAPQAPGQRLSSQPIVIPQMPSGEALGGGYASKIERMPNSLLGLKVTDRETFLFLYDNPLDPKTMIVTSDRMRNEKNEQLFAVYKVKNIKVAVKDKYGQIVKDAFGKPKIEVRIIEKDTAQVEMRKSIEANMDTHTVTAMGKGVSETGKNPADPMHLYVRNSGENKVYVINELVPEFPPDVIDGANVVISDGVVTIKGAENYYMERYRLDTKNNAILKDVTSGKEKGTYLFDLEIYRTHGKWLLTEKTDAKGRRYIFGYDNKVDPKIRVVQKAGEKVSYVSKLGFAADGKIGEGMTQLLSLRYDMEIPANHQVDLSSGKPYAEIAVRGEYRYTTYVNESYVPDNLRGKIFRANAASPWQSDALVDAAGNIIVRYFYDVVGDEDNPGKLIQELDYKAAIEKKLYYDGDTNRVAKVEETLLDKNRSAIPGTTRTFDYDTKTPVLLTDRPEIKIGRITRIIEPDGRVSKECYYTQGSALIVSRDVKEDGLVRMLVNVFADASCGNAPDLSRARKEVVTTTVLVPLTDEDKNIDTSKAFEIFNGAMTSFADAKKSSPRGIFKLTDIPEQGSVTLIKQSWDVLGCLGIVLTPGKAESVENEIFDHIRRAMANDYSKFIKKDGTTVYASKILEKEIWSEMYNLVQSYRKARDAGELEPITFIRWGRFIKARLDAFEDISFNEFFVSNKFAREYYDNVRYVRNSLLAMIESENIDDVYRLFNHPFESTDIVRWEADVNSRTSAFERVVDLTANPLLAVQDSVSGKKYVDMTNREVMLLISSRISEKTLLQITCVDINGSRSTFAAEIKGNAGYDKLNAEDRAKLVHRVEFAPSTKDGRYDIKKNPNFDPSRVEKVIISNHVDLNVFDIHVKVETLLGVPRSH